MIAMNIRHAQIEPQTWQEFYIEKNSWTTLGLIMLTNLLYIVKIQT
jgi:hypothetical protein